MPTNIIPKMFIKDLHNNLSKINDNIDKNTYYNDNIFEKFDHIDYNQIIIYIFIFVIVFFILSGYDIKFSKVISIIVGLGIVYILMHKNYYFNKYKERDLDIQSKFIQKLLYDNDNWYSYDLTEQFNIVPVPNYLYLQYEPKLLTFFYDNKDFGQFNMNSYTLSIVHCNNVINLQLQILDGSNDYQLLEIMKTEIQHALNAFESIIHKINTVRDINDKSNKLQVLLNNIYTKSLMTIVNRNENIENSIHKKPNSILLQTLYTNADDTKTINYSPHYDYF